MKVYLKYNKQPKEDSKSLECLLKWIKIFKSYDITIITDIYQVNDTQPEEFLSFADLRFINTDYSLSSELNHMLKTSRWKKVAASNLSCYKDSNYQPFWLIDADDTMFLNEDYNLLIRKIKDAETIFLNEKLHGFSLDFYRTIKRDHWSFGMALLQNFKELMDILKTTEESDFIKYKLTLNLDCIFDVNRRKNKLRLKSFVFNNFYFQHYLEQKMLPNGTYYWNQGKLWDHIPINKEVIII